MSTAANIVAGAVKEHFPAGSTVRIGKGRTAWTVAGHDDEWISLTCISTTGAPQNKALIHDEALARLTRLT